MNLVPTPPDHFDRIRLEVPDYRDDLPSGILVATLEPDRYQTCGGYWMTRPHVELAALLANAERMRNALERLADGEWPTGTNGEDAIATTRAIAREAIKRIRDTIRAQTGKDPQP